MVVWHVTSANKLQRYRQSGVIMAPVRAWRDINMAARMSLRTGRPMILRLRFPDNAPVLEGHFGKAVVLEHDLRLPKELYDRGVLRK